MSDYGFIEFPGPGGDWQDFLLGRGEAALARASDLVATLKDGQERAPMQVAELWNELDVSLAGIRHPASVLAEVHPDAAARASAEECPQRIESFAAVTVRDPDLFQALGSAADALVADPEGDHDLPPLLGRWFDRVLRDFRRAGVAAEPASRARITELVERQVVLGQEFGRNIREGTRTIRIAPERLDGLPEDFLAAHPAEADGLVTLSTDYPDSVPVRTFARDPDVRREMVLACLNVGWPANDEVLGELLRSRDERARLLGYSGWPDFDAETKMIGTGAAISEFIDRLTGITGERAERDRAVLLARLNRDRPTVQTLDAADAGYYAEVIRREQFHVDATEVRRYFDFDRVRAGLLEVTGALFGLTYRPVEIACWHGDVAVYEVLRPDEDDRVIGRIFLDLFPRPGKFKHAAQFDLITGISGRQLPEATLVCNFSRGLMSHTEVITLFHEFGHLLHHLLGGDQSFARYSGVATEWDFVEAPSQMLEEWAWDHTVLATFAQDRDGTTIPAALVARMVAAKDFGRAYLLRVQLFYSALSYGLHAQVPADIGAFLAQMQSHYDVLDRIPDTHMYASFGHLDGYSSGYYTYLWSQVIAKDLFSGFDTGALMNPQIAGRYRDAVLAPGGSADAADLVTRFLGRSYSFDAFAAWLAQEPEPV